MVKSAVRTMDTTSDLADRQLNQKVDKFIVSGGSKHGWTTWLTAVADPRVCAIAPMVIDMLNTSKQMKHQVQSYGKYSDKIQPYTDLDIPDRMDSYEGRRLMQIVDPYTYRDRMTMPKLVVLGTSDPYWTVDASSFYFGDLPGPRYLYYLPNAGHGLGVGMMPTLLAFMNASLNETALPKLDWTAASDWSLKVTLDHPLASATLWQAASPTRDFRKATWPPSAIEGKGQCTVRLDAPKEVYLAYFVQVRLVGASGLPYDLSTTITVLPDTLPFARADATE